MNIEFLYQLHFFYSIEQILINYFNIKTNDKKLLLRFVIMATTSSGKLAEKILTRI